MSDTYLEDFKRANEKKTKVEGLLKERKAAWNTGNPTARFDFLIKSARLNLNEDIGLLERHAYTYKFGNQTEMSKKEKNARVEQINKFVEKARQLIDAEVDLGQKKSFDPESQPFMVGADGEHDDVRGKTKD